MDYPEQQQKFLADLQYYFDGLVVNEGLINLVKDFFPVLWSKNKNPSEPAIKAYILWLIQNRYSCRQIIRMLKESQNLINIQLAKDLELLNTPPGRKFYDEKFDIDVTPVLPKDRKEPNSVTYSMTKKNRGRAYVVNAVPNLIRREAQRFVHIFEQMLFKTQGFYGLTTTQMMTELTQLSVDIKTKFEYINQKDEAVIIMVICKGNDQEIAGANHPSCGGNDPDDVVSIHQIVELFADIPDIPKLFFFNHCRELNKSAKSENTSKNWTDTYIFHSCAEGYQTNHDDNYTLYGKMLSESFAQYACYEDLVQIMNKTYQILRDIISGKPFNVHPDSAFSNGLPLPVMASSSPELLNGLPFSETCGSAPVLPNGLSLPMAGNSVPVLPNGMPFSTTTSSSPELPNGLPSQLADICGVNTNEVYIEIDCNTEPVAHNLYKEIAGNFTPDNQQGSTTRKLYFNPGWFEDK